MHSLKPQWRDVIILIESTVNAPCKDVTWTDCARILVHIYNVSISNRQSTLKKYADVPIT